ncbi:MAG TPA: Rrf2 family transcriptional regulator [Candidatus Hungatella pullicola]|nr:Rrf2 family transcriptional regulator [Candidatus Hungatella pullicola]
MTSEFAIAVHSLVYLDHRQETISSEALASNVCTNPARVRKVMAKLKKAGLIETKEGLDGGYHIADSLSQINLRQISEALEVSFVSAVWKSGNGAMPCMIASGMADVMDEIYQELNEVCKNRLESLTIQDIKNRIFKGEKTDCGNHKK